MVKIGVTTNPEARLASLRTGSAFPIDYEYIGCTPGPGFDIEKEAHSMLSKYSCNGEWFDVTPELATSVVTGAAAKLGRPMCVVANVKVASEILRLAASAESPLVEPGVESWLGSVSAAVGILFGFGFFGSIALVAAIGVVHAAKLPSDWVPAVIGLSIGLMSVALGLLRVGIRRPFHPALFWVPILVSFCLYLFMVVAHAGCTYFMLRG